MDRQDLIIKAIDELKDDLVTRTERLEEKVDEGFKAMNGRVRKTENDLLRIKTLWIFVSGSIAFVFHYIFG